MKKLFMTLAAAALAVPAMFAQETISFQFKGTLPANLNDCVSILDQGAFMYEQMMGDGDPTVGQINVNSNPLTVTLTDNDLVNGRFMLQFTSLSGYVVSVSGPNGDETDYYSIQSGQGNTMLSGLIEDCDGLIFTVTVEEAYNTNPLYLLTGTPNEVSQPALSDNKFTLIDPQNSIYSGTFTIPAGKSFKLWCDTGISMMDEDLDGPNLTPFGPAVEDAVVSQSIVFNSEISTVQESVDMNMAYWTLNNLVDCQVQFTVNLSANTILMTCLNNPDAITINFLSSQDLEYDAFNYVSIDSYDAIEDTYTEVVKESNIVNVAVVDNSRFVFRPEIQGASFTIECEGYEGDAALEQDIFKLEGDDMLDGVYILSILDPAAANGLVFNVEVSYEQPLNEQEIEVTLNFAGEVENDAYTYVEFEGEALPGGQYTQTTIKNNVTVFKVHPTVTFSFTPVEGYRIVSIYGPEGYETMEIVRPPLNKENGTWSVNLFPGGADNVYLNITVAEGETSGVGSLGADSLNAPVYNLQGVKVANDVNNLPAGLYIVNGKKVLVK